MPYRAVCGRCGARRSDAQIGLEESPQAYVATLVEVFREVRRVLRPDGTCWIVIGDAYNAAGRVGHGTRIGPKQQTNRASATGQDHARATAPGLKPKDLIGIPWMLAFALRDAGWYLRSDIIWSKTAAMPESVRDRPTRSHEYIFLLSKNKRYYYDAEAVREPTTPDMLVRAAQGRGRGPNGRVDASRNDADRLWRGRPATADGHNRRSVWTLGPQPLTEEHYAAFPDKLVEPCILAGCPEGGTVLDPFCGSGTALLVAKRYGRSAIGIDLNPAYCAMARKRVDSIPYPLFGPAPRHETDGSGAR